MTRRRRKVAFRTPFHRIQMWDKKMESTTYAIYLERTKPFALQKFAEYQVTHEYLIRVVKSVTAKYPEESNRQHAYMWFAQGIWYVRMRYSSQALQKEADALFLYWFYLGLKEEVLREIANKLGVTISSWDKLLGRLGMSEEIVYKGTKKALQETLNDVDVNPVDVSFEYDPTTGNLIKIIKTDKVTGKKKIVTLEYDAQGNLIKKSEQWA